MTDRFQCVLGGEVGEREFEGAGTQRPSGTVDGDQLGAAQADVCTEGGVVASGGQQRGAGTADGGGRGLGGGRLLHESGIDQCGDMSGHRGL